MENYVNEKYDSKSTGYGFYTVPAVSFRGYVIKCPYGNVEAEAHQFGPLQGPWQYILTIHLGGAEYDPVLQEDGTYKKFDALDDIKEYLADSKYGKRKVRTCQENKRPASKQSKNIPKKTGIIVSVNCQGKRSFTTNNKAVIQEANV